MIQSEAYTKRFCRGIQTQNSKHARTEMQKFGLQDYEQTLIINLGPRSADEAIALIPVLAKFKKDELEEVLARVSEFLSH